VINVKSKGTLFYATWHTNVLENCFYIGKRDKKIGGEATDLSQIIEENGVSANKKKHDSPGKKRRFIGKGDCSKKPAGP